MDTISTIASHMHVKSILYTQLTAKGPVSMAIVPGLASVRASMGMKDNSVTEVSVAFRVPLF